MKALAQVDVWIRTSQRWLFQVTEPVTDVFTAPENRISRAVLGLTHSIAHRAMKSLAARCGLNVDSLAEYLFPSNGAFLIYANTRSEFILGGLEHVFRYDLADAMSEFDAESRCVFDPPCRHSFGGSCAACLYVSEIACARFNTVLDRNLLFGTLPPAVGVPVDGVVQWRGYWTPRGRWLHCWRRRRIRFRPRSELLSWRPAARTAPLLAAVTGVVADGPLVRPALMHAGVLDAAGAVTAAGATRLAQTLVLIEATQAGSWQLVLTVPGFLRGALDACVAGHGDGARPRETTAVLREVAGAARKRLLIAAPYLHEQFVHVLAPDVERVLADGGRVEVITRALSLTTPARSSANVSAVTFAA